MICTNSQENCDILNYCVLNVTVCERLSPELHRLVCVIVSLFSCPTLNRYYVR